jgi:hypothetical protein
MSRSRPFPSQSGRRHAERHAGEVHRWFPEWANRPAWDGRPRESDRNSYLAGGYAEEFGYHVRPDAPLALAPFAGEPERSRQWRAQFGAVHPGYPECPRPVDRETHSDAAASFTSPGARPSRADAGADRAREGAQIKIIRVGLSHRGRAVHGAFLADLALLWKAFLIRRRERNRLL